MSRGSNTFQALRTRCPLSRTISGGMQVFLICRAAEASHACQSSRRDRKDRTTKTYCRLPKTVQQPQPLSHCGSHILGGQGTGQVRRALLLLSDPTKNVVSTYSHRSLEQAHPRQHERLNVHYQRASRSQSIHGQCTEASSSQWSLLVCTPRRRYNLTLWSSRYVYCECSSRATHSLVRRLRAL